MRASNKMTIDSSLLLAVVLLLTLGLLMVYSASFHLPTVGMTDDPLHFLKRQTYWLVFGAVALAVAALVPYHLWFRLATPLMGLGLLALIAVLLLGTITNNTRSWFGSGSIQPSEAAKLAFIIYIAAWLASKGDKVRDLSLGLVPFSIILGLVTGLIMLQPDRGTAMVVVAIAVTMFFVSGAELLQLLVGTLIGGAALAVVLLRSELALERLLIWFRSDSDPLGAVFQVRAAVNAFASGGLTGRGLGAGVQKFLPPFVHHSDTIFAVIGEELGLLGCLVVIGLYLFIAYRGMMISFHAPDGFSQLVAFGITAWFIIQAMVHIGGNTGMVPFTGITLPFISYGGSSLTMCMAAVGVLLSISRVTVERNVLVAAFALSRRNRRPRLSSASRVRRVQRRRSR